MKVFCERLKELRQEKNLSSIALGNVLGVSHSTILRWENGEILPTILHLYNIAKFFNISSDYLLGLEN